MKRSKFAEEQVAYALRHAESAAPLTDACRQTGISGATFFNWKKKHAHPGVSEPRRLRRVEDENRLLKQVVAELTLDQHMWNESGRQNLSPMQRRAFAE